MRHVSKLLVAVVVAAIAVAAVPALAAPPGLKARPIAVRWVGEFYKQVGGGNNAKSYWTSARALTGTSSVYMAKNVPTTDLAAAAISVLGTGGLTVADLGVISYDMYGGCFGGSPRVNVYYDNDGDGTMDGYAFVASCGGTPGVNGWLHVAEDPLATPYYAYAAPQADGEVLGVEVIVDVQSELWLDNLTVAGVNLGEPGR